MLIKDLVTLLLSHNPNARALLMTQRKQPFENGIVGVVARSQMADQEGRDEPGLASDDVFLAVGKRIRPGSLSAWIVAERPQQESVALQLPGASAECEQTLEGIAREYLDVESLTSSGSFEDDLAHLTLDDLHCALLAAYHAGIAVTLKQLSPPSSENHSEFY
jgi:hypothetical protein